MKMLCLFFFLFSVIAQASCGKGEYLDLRNTYPKIFKNIKIKNQGNYGLCYAYAGTTLIDFFGNKKGVMGSSNTSPLEAGVLGTIAAENESEEGGDICAVVNAVSKQGKACTDSIVGKEERFLGVGSDFHTQVVQQVFMPYIQRTETFKAVPVASFNQREGLSKGQKNYLKRFDTFYKNFRPQIVARGFSQKEIPKAEDIFKFAQKIHADNTYFLLAPSFTKLLVRSLCVQQNITVPKLSCESLKKVSPDTMVGEIDEQMSLKNPVGIAYCSSVLTNKTAGGMDFSGHPKPNCGLHASVIIGRKSDSSGNCHYLIRNSWGESFKYAWPTDRGDIWLSEYMLKRSIYEVHSVK